MRAKVLTLLKTKALVLVMAIVLVIGGATAVFAATPSGQNVLHTLAQSNPTGTVTPGHQSDSDQNDDKDAEDNGQNCDDGNTHPTATATPANDKDAEGNGQNCDDGNTHPTATATPADD